MSRDLGPGGGLWAIHTLESVRDQLQIKPTAKKTDVGNLIQKISYRLEELESAT